MISKRIEANPHGNKRKVDGFVVEVAMAEWFCCDKEDRKYPG